MSCEFLEEEEENLALHVKMDRRRFTHIDDELRAIRKWIVSGVVSVGLLVLAQVVLTIFGGGS